MFLAVPGAEIKVESSLFSRAKDFVQYGSNRNGGQSVAVVEGAARRSSLCIFVNGSNVSHWQTTFTVMGTA